MKESNRLSQMAFRLAIFLLNLEGHKDLLCVHRFFSFILTIWNTLSNQIFNYLRIKLAVILCYRLSNLTTSQFNLVHHKDMFSVHCFSSFVYMRKNTVNIKYTSNRITRSLVTRKPDNSNKFFGPVVVLNSLRVLFCVILYCRSVNFLIATNKEVASSFKHVF